MNRRDRFTIIMDMLASASVPIKKTPLLYKTEMNFNRFDKYIELLVSLGMMKEVKKPFKGYVTTPLGKEFLELFNETRSDLPRVKKR